MKSKKDKERIEYLRVAIRCNAHNCLSGCGYMGVIYETDYCDHCRYHAIGCYKFDRKTKVI